MDRAILHCDMNNFYASVECKLDKSLKGKPVAVCGDNKERHGIVLARNDIAKKFNINVGEPIWMVKNKCKDIIIITKPHFNEYEKHSKLAKEIYKRYTDLVEPYGLDECYLDITHSIKLFGKPKKIADEIRSVIKKELDLTISVGVSFNKVFAKLGSDLKKPDATVEITKENYKEIVWKLPISCLLGVGHKTEKVLKKYFINTIGDIAKEKQKNLEYILGKSGMMLYKYANGQDDSEVSKFDSPSDVKSIGHGITTTKDLVNNEEVWKVMLELTQEIAYKLRNYNMRAKGISLSIRLNDLSWEQYQKKLEYSLKDSISIAKEAFELFKNRFDWKKDIRNITITAIYLINEGEPEQLNFFDDINFKNKNETLEKSMDMINIKYGENSIKLATLMDNSNLPDSRRKMKYEI